MSVRVSRPVNLVCVSLSLVVHVTITDATDATDAQGGSRALGTGASEVVLVRGTAVKPIGRVSSSQSLALLRDGDGLERGDLARSPSLRVQN